MIKVVFALQALIITCVSCASTEVYRSQIAAESTAAASGLGLVGIGIPNSPQLGSIPDLGKPVENTLQVNVGPQTLKLRSFYQEKREQEAGSNDSFQGVKFRRHFSLLASSSFAGSNLIGETELAYSPLDSTPGEYVLDEWPMFLRLGLKNSWRGFSYGADYRSFGAGFVSPAGVRIDQPRDEGELWGEHSFGLLRIRGSVGESWEKLSNTNEPRVTKTATAAFTFNRPQWEATLASTYGLVEQGFGLSQENTIFNTNLSGSYRPIGVLSLTPQFGIREERDQNSGVRTETPMAGFTITYEPYRDWFKLTGGTSYARSFSGDRLKDVTTFGANAALDWKLGNFFPGEESLSLNLNYNRQLDFSPSNNIHRTFGGMLHFKITGF